MSKNEFEVTDNVHRTASFIEKRKRGQQREAPLVTDSEGTFFYDGTLKEISEGTQGWMSSFCVLESFQVRFVDL